MHWWIYANSLGKWFDKLSLNAARCQTAYNTEPNRAAIELELKDLKDLQMNKYFPNIYQYHLSVWYLKLHLYRHNCACSIFNFLCLQIELINLFMLKRVGFVKRIA